MKSRFQSNLLNLIAIFSIFLCFFYISYLTPMQCDDFWYHHIGLNLDRHINHYLDWSGRIVADYFSSTLLRIPSHFVSTAIIASFSTGICYLIVKIPTAIDPDYKSDAWKFCVIAALYWVANPQIEDSTFWVVGACNYVVTTFFVLLFVYYILNTSKSFSWWILGLALIAGCSNENTCIAMIYTMLVLWMISHFKRINSLTLNFKLNKKFFTACFIFFIIGSLVLMLAPGNFQRTQSETCSKWCKLSLNGKISTFIDHSRWYLPKMQKGGEFYLLILFLTGISLNKNRKAIYWSLLFFSTAIVSWIVMIASPYFPERSLNPTLCFLLVAISFLMSFNLIKYRPLKLILATAIVWIFWLFFTFFAVMCEGHKAIMIQDAIRIDHIKYKREKFGKHITVDIPQHYINPTLRNYEISFSFEFIPFIMEARWNGVDELNHIPVNYEYAALRLGKKLPVINKTELREVKIYFLQQSFSQNTVMIESLDPIEYPLILQCLYSKEIINIKLNEKPIELLGRYYIGTQIERSIDLSEPIIIKKI